MLKKMYYRLRLLTLVSLILVLTPALSLAEVFTLPCVYRVEVDTEDRVKNTAQARVGRLLQTQRRYYVWAEFDIFTLAGKTITGLGLRVYNAWSGTEIQSLKYISKEPGLLSTTAEVLLEEQNTFANKYDGFYWEINSNGSWTPSENDFFRPSAEYWDSCRRENGKSIIDDLQDHVDSGKPWFAIQFGCFNCSTRANLSFPNSPNKTSIYIEIQTGEVCEEEICDGLDNDCDRLIDEDLGTTTCGLGECEHIINNCVNGVEQICDPMEGATEEICDGLDNDCDGLIDEDLGTTTCGLGECEHTISNCVNGIKQECDPLEGVTEEICDGFDNDCDGLIDEGLTFDKDGDGHSTPDSCEGTKDDCDDNDPGKYPGNVEICGDGIDQDCDGVDPPCSIDCNQIICANVSDYDSCGIPGIKGAIWGQFGYREVIEAASGEKLWIECREGEGVNYYLMLYYNPITDTTYWVGIDPFEAGCNITRFCYCYIEGADGPAIPRFFDRTYWLSKDYGENDVPNPWTGEQDEDPPFLDWAEIISDIPNLSMIKISNKYEYLIGPPVPEETCDNPSFPRPEGVLTESLVIDPPLMPPESDSFLNKVIEILQTQSPPSGPMKACAFQPCDLNSDGECDTSDVQLFLTLLGVCRGEVDYNPLADVDGDGCVSLEDQQNLFRDSDDDGVYDSVDNCPKNENSSQEDRDNDKIGDACDNCPNIANIDQLDNDDDGICADVDNCPDVYNPGQEDSDGDGLGDACDKCIDDPAKKMISILPSLLDFGDVCINNSLTKSLVIENIGCADLALNGQNFQQNGFKANYPAVTLRPGETKNIDVIFGPESAGNKSSTLNIKSDASLDPISIPLQGNGISLPCLDFLKLGTDSKHIRRDQPPGSVQFNVPIYLDISKDIFSIKFEIFYNTTVLTATSLNIVTSRITSSLTPYYIDDLNGRIIVSLIDLYGQAVVKSGTGKIIELILSLDQAQFGSFSLDIRYVEDVYATDGTALTLATQNGEINILEDLVCLADVDCHPTLSLFDPEVNGCEVSQNGVTAVRCGNIDTSWCKDTSPDASGNGPFKFIWGDGSESCSWFLQKHTYSSSGTYNIRVRVKNTCGYIAERNKNVTVSCVTPITVITPNGGEIWGYGEQHIIQWDPGLGTGSTVKIEYKAGMSSWATITSSTSNNGSYSWTPDDSAYCSYSALIRVTSSDGYSDQSDADFAVDCHPTLSLLDPEVNGCEVSQNGVTYARCGDIDKSWCKDTSPDASGNGPFKFIWGDGSESCSWFIPKYTYSSSGTYNIRVRVKNTCGYIAERNKSVQIASGAGMPDLIVSSLSVTSYTSNSIYYSYAIW